MGEQRAGARDPSVADHGAQNEVCKKLCKRVMRNMKFAFAEHWGQISTGGPTDGLSACYKLSSSVHMPQAPQILSVAKL
jgi:hypothetical protein